MTPEEDYNLDVWLTLQKIKSEVLLLTSKVEFIDFQLSTFVGVGVVYYCDEAKILRQLEEWGAIKFEDIDSASKNWVFPGGRVKIRPIQTKFGMIYKRYSKYEQDESQTLQFEKKNLTDTNEIVSKFDDSVPCILLCNEKIELPKFKNEHYLCRALFKIKTGHTTDWSIIYEKMQEQYHLIYGKPLKIRNNWRPIYDTVVRLNNRIKSKLNITKDLFSWKDLTITRNF